MENNKRNAGYSITIANDKKPAALDFHSLDPGNQGTPQGSGIIRRKGDVVEIISTFGTLKRAASFDPPPEDQWLLTLKKER